VSPDAELVAAAERAVAEAHVRLDAAALDELFHDAYVVLQPDGTIERKADILASFATGSRSWEFAEVDELEIASFGASATVVGRWRARGRNGDVRFDYAARFLSVWIKADGRWRNVAYQAAEIPF